LECRLVPSTYTVQTNGNATGPVTGGGGVFSAPTLRAAIDAANLAGGTNTINFAAALAGATIPLTSNDTSNPFAFGPTALVIGKAPASPDILTIQGDAAPGIIISGNDARRVFGVFAGSSLTLEDVTITGGKAIGGKGGSGGGGGAGLGGAIFNDGTLKLLQSTLTGNTAVGGNGGGSPPSGFGGGGGAAAGYSGGSGSGYGNGGGGGGVGGPGGPGGAFGNAVGGPGGKNELGVSETTSGTSGTSGGGGAGGIIIDGYATGGSGSQVSSGGFGGGGGGGSGFGYGITPGAAGGSGGFAGGGGAGGGNRYTGGFPGGAGGFGGGGGGGGPPGAGGFAGSTGGGGSNRYGGGGAGLGGAIFNNAGTVTITNSTLTGNTAQGGAAGGGSGGGQGLGGAVFNLNGSLTLLNSTLSGNTAAQGGGGIFNLGSTKAGGGYSTGTGTVTISNTILANSTGGASDFDGSGTQAFGPGNATNLIGTNHGFVGSGTITGVNPVLSALGNFGGPTRTLALLPGSPAIKAGTNAGAPATDQRGVSRPQLGTVDIGAFESQGFTQSMTGGDNQAVDVSQLFPIPLQVTVAPKNGTDPVAGGVVTFTGPSSGGGIDPAKQTAVIAGNGTASLSVRANSSAGGPYTVAATATGAAGPVNFSLTNIPASVYIVQTAGNATGPVTPTGPETFSAPTLRAAIDAANLAGGTSTITFAPAVAGATIILTGNDTTNPFAFGPTALVIGKTSASTDILTIQGDAALGITISGDDARRVLGIFAGSTLTLEDVTIAGGKALGGSGGNPGGGGGGGLGGAIFNEGTLNVLQSTVTGNTAVGGAGGGIGATHVYGGGGGGAPGYSGGAGSMYYGGGGGGVGGAGAPGGASAAGSGGNNELGMSAGSGHPGTAGGGGGGASLIGGSGQQLSSAGFGGGGGGGYHSAGSGGFGAGGGGSGSAFPRNAGQGGFGGGGGGGSLRGIPGFGGGFGGADYGFRSGGGGAGLGGAIFNDGGTVTITNSTFTANSAVGGAAGSEHSGAGKGLGGGVFNLNGTLTLLNSTLSGNTAAQGGGCIYNYSTGTGTVNMSNTILAKSTGNVTDFAGFGGQTFGAGNATNLILNNNGFVGTGTITGVNPLLSALGNFGGPTRTLALLPGSPAINAGTNTGAPATDQRGVSRPQQLIVDIGAFESQGFTLSSAGGNNQAAVVGRLFQQPLQVTVTPKNGTDPVAGGVVTFTGPASGAGISPVTNTAVIAADGTASLHARANDRAGGPYSVAATATGAPAPVHFSLTNNPGLIAVAVGSTEVQVYNADGSLRFDFYAYDPSVLTGGVRVAVGELNGDGVLDIITVPGPGAAAEVKAFDGATGALVRHFYAFPGSVTTGFSVAAGDLNRNGLAEIVVGTDAGVAGEVRAFSGTTTAMLVDFYPYGAFTGGVRVAVGDVDGDRFDDIITGTGPGTAARVRAFSGADGTLLRDFYAFPGSYLGGIYVAAGDTNGDALADIIAGAGIGAAEVRTFDGASSNMLLDFYAYGGAFQGGVRVGFTATGETDFGVILTSPGPVPTGSFFPMINTGQPILAPLGSALALVQQLDGVALADVDTFFGLNPNFNGGAAVGGA
jgi:hypothetical protein